MSDGRWQMDRVRLKAAPLVLPLVTMVVAVGCQQPMKTPAAVVHGDYGAARVELYRSMTANRNDRMYLLDRMRVAVLTMADGYAASAGYVFEEVYEILRTQGINEDKTVESVVLNEDLRFWKGEPFEQALALAFYSMQQASLGSWDNARAAADNALFYLKDFGTDDRGQRIDTAEIARRSLIYEQALDRGEDPDRALEEKGEDYLDSGYVAVQSNFTLGYLLNGVANRMLDRPEEANDNFRRVAAIDPSLKELMQSFREGQYNTVLIVAYGLGPEKIGYGPSDSLARFVPRFRSDAAQLSVQVDGLPARRYPQVLDVNVMAADHMWNNLADVRAAKAVLGDVLLGGGAIAAGAGAVGNSDAALIAGASAVAAGLFLKAGAHVDVRYCDVMPQRLYAVPLFVADQRATITLQVDGRPWTQLTLTGLNPARDGLARLRYVALVSAGPTPPPWATSGQVFYGNADTGPMPGATFPYILGGDDVQLPSDRVLDDYQASGYLTGFTLADLNELYRSERIAYTRQDQGGYAGRHVLEGGGSLVIPLAATAGFARILGQVHPPYEPQSSSVRQAADEIRNRN